MKTLYIHVILAFTLLFHIPAGKAQNSSAGPITEAKINNELMKDSIGLSKKDKIELPYRSVYSNYMVGSASVIQGKDLNRKIDLNATSALKGQAAGLYISETPGAHRESAYNISIRGLNTQDIGNAAPLIIIDGVERSISYLQAEDIESVTVLKDAVAKSFYNGKAANGVIMITTKRGVKNKNTRRISVESGLSMPNSLPEFMNSEEYATSYNLARRNSGLSDLYSATEINGYKNPNKRYPSNDYYDLLLNDSKNYTKVSADFTGGNESLQYFIGAGYVHNGGLEAVGNSNSMNQFSIRSNLDYSISSAVKAFLDVYGFVDQNNTNYLQANELFSKMSTQRPNEYTVILQESNFADSIAYGSGRYGTNSQQQNLYAEMLLGGLRENTQRIGQMNFGFHFDLNSILKGLTAKAGFTFDSYNYTSIGKNDDFYSYLPVWDNNNNLVERTLITVGKKNSDMSNLDSDGYRKYSLQGQINYHNRFDNHRIEAGLVFYGDQTEIMYATIKNKSQSNTLLMNYSWKDKWIAEVNLGLLGSSKLTDSSYGFFPAAGVGWVLSKEDFMSGTSWVDYLKLKASYGISGSDDALNYFAYQTRWNYIANSKYYTYFGAEATASARTATISTYANPSIDWEKSAELNVGIETVLFNDFSLHLDYFHINRTNIPFLTEDIYTQVWGIYNQQINYLEIENNGLDLTLGYSKNAGDWRFRGNLNANYSFSKYVKSTSWADLLGNRQLNGKAVDAYVGLVSQGIIKNTGDMPAVPQSFGETGIGDLKYENLNGDGKIDQNDVKEIGNSFPRLQFGLNLFVDYKNFGLSISGYGAAIYDIYLNNTYYRPMPESAYSVHARNAYNPETGQGSYPRLTTTNSANNYQLSDFWLKNGSFFKIKDVELSYTLPRDLSQKILLSSLRFFVKGNNLLTISGIDDLDPECINAGITSYPFMRTFTAGFNLTF